MWFYIVSKQNCHMSSMRGVFVVVFWGGQGVGWLLFLVFLVVFLKRYFFLEVDKLISCPFTGIHSIMGRFNSAALSALLLLLFLI